jgi:hypothetical protein
MSAEVVRNALLWCTVINYGLLLVWSLAYRVARGGVHQLWGRWFRLSGEQFDALSFAALAVYKVGILLFNLVPYVALLLVG